MKKLNKIESYKKLCEYKWINLLTANRKIDYKKIVKNRIDFYVTYYKNIIEILEWNKSNFKKFKENIFMEQIHKWLLNFRVTTKNKIEFTLENPDHLIYIDKLMNWEDVSVDDFSWLRESIDEYNKNIKEEYPEEEFYWELLDIEKQMYLWNDKEITFL